MANQLRVIKLGLEELVLAERGKGRSLEQMRDACNAELALRASTAGVQGKVETVSKPAIERYLGRLDEASVAPAHQPQLAEENARLSIDFARRLTRLDELLGRWLDEADQAVTPMRGVLWDPYHQQPLDAQHAKESAALELDRLQDALECMPDDAAAALREWIAPSTVLVPDWKARTSVAKELRGLLDLYADVMGRIYDAQQVKDFQEAMLATIEDASPETARAIVARLNTMRDARKAALFGASA